MLLDNHRMDFVPYTDVTDNLWITEFAFYVCTLYIFILVWLLWAMFVETWKHDPEFTRVAISSFFNAEYVFMSSTLPAVKLGVTWWNLRDWVTWQDNVVTQHPLRQRNIWLRWGRRPVHAMFDTQTAGGLGISSVFIKNPAVAAGIREST